MATNVKNKPPKPSNVSAIKRTKNKYKVTWKIPKTGSNSSSDSRWEKLYRTWWRWNGKKKKAIKESTIAVNSTSNELSLSRDDYYPVKGKPKVTKLSFDIQPWNIKGSPAAIKKTYEFEKPDAPKVEYTYDDTRNILTVKIEMKEKKAKRERYNTTYTLWRRNTGLQSSVYTNGKWVKAVGTDSTDSQSATPHQLTKTTKLESITLTHDVGISRMPSGAKIEFVLTSTTRGLAGQTKVKKAKAPKYVVMPPKDVYIKSIVVEDTATGKPISTWNADKTRAQVLVAYAVPGDTAKYNPEAMTTYELQRIVTSASISEPAQASAQTWSTTVDKNTGTTSDSIKKSTKAAVKNGPDGAKNNGNYVIGGSSIKDKGNYTTPDIYDAVMGEPMLDVVNEMMNHQSVSGVPFDCRVWYRIKATRQGIVMYSDPVEATQFYIPTPSAANDYSAFLLMSSGDNGTAIDTLLGWDNPNKEDEGVDDWPDATWTTEVSWAEYPNSWTSTKKPSTFDVNWMDTESEHSARQDGAGYIDGDINPQADRIKWKKTAECSIKELTPGTPYYLKTRRHMKYGDIESYGPYTPAPEGYWPFTPVDNPTEVICNVDGPLILGEPLNVSWSHDATAKQKTWVVYVVEIPTLRQDSGDSSLPLTVPANTLAKKSIIAGEDETDFVTIPWENLTEIFPSVTAYKKVNGVQTEVTLDTSTKIGIGVTVSTGGTPVDSYADALGLYSGLEIVEVVSRSICESYIPSTMTAQPGTFYVFTDTTMVEAVCSIVAKGITVPMPDKDIIQAEDDYIWSGLVAEADSKALSDFPSGILTAAELAELTEAGYQYFWEVDLPAGLDLYDGGDYVLEASCVSTIDPLLKSFAEDKEFSVSYSHQAMPAGPRSRCETRMNGGSPYVEVYVQKPENWASTDRCNVYRITPDKAYLIAEDVEFESTVIDRYPPFSKVARLRYAITTVTADRDFATREIPYALRRHGLRYDWGPLTNGRNDQFVELPYDIELTDAFEKDVEVRKHMDGENDAYFNQGVKRTGTHGTKLVKLADPDQFEKVRQLAEYPGTVLCRAHDGTCYEAVVNVTGLDNKFDSLTSVVSISTEEVSLTSRFRTDAADIRKVNEQTG